MCFSAEVSFAASAGLLVAGAKAVYDGDKTTRAISLVPIFFSIHQFSEGMNWVTYSDPPHFWKTFFNHTYALIQYSFWPTYMPICAYLMEPKENVKRSRLQFISIFIGIVYSAYWIYLTLSDGVQVGRICAVQAECHGLNYIVKFPPFKMDFFYVGLVTIPMMFSSYHFAKAMGLLTGLAYFAAQQWFLLSFGSTWCFFAALLSIIVIMIIREVKKCSPQRGTA